MSEENKCNGLDCAICAETKCPNEKPIINGIDVSESVLTATNNDVYYSQKAVDELQNVIKRLQEENEELKKRQITKNGFICDCEQNAKYKQALEEIREITEQDRNCMNSELACCRLCEKLDLIKEKTNEVLNDRD